MSKNKPSPQRWWHHFFVKIRLTLLAGLVVWLPLVVTFWLLKFLVTSIDGMQHYLPDRWQPSLLFGQNIPGFGLLLVTIILLTTGFLARNFIGIKIIKVWEKMLNRIPIVKTIYRGVKQVSDNLFSDSSNAFREAVLVEFPRSGVWTIAFVTTKQPPDVDKSVGNEFDGMIGVYVPTTPNPTSGYLIWVQPDDLRPLAMSVEVALKAVVTMGVMSGTSDKAGIPNSTTSALPPPPSTNATT